MGNMETLPERTAMKVEAQDVKEAAAASNPEPTILFSTREPALLQAEALPPPRDLPPETSPPSSTEMTRARSRKGLSRTLRTSSSKGIVGGKTGSSSKSLGSKEASVSPVMLRADRTDGTESKLRLDEVNSGLEETERLLDLSSDEFNSGSPPKTGAAGFRADLAFHSGQPLLVLVDTRGRSQGGEGDAMFSSIPKSKKGSEETYGRVAQYLNDTGGSEEIKYDRLSQIVLPWDPKLKSAPGVLLKDVRVMQHLKDRLMAMEKARQEKEDEMGISVLTDAQANCDKLTERVERAKRALDKAEQWNKALKDMAKVAKEAGGPKGKFDPALLTHGSSLQPKRKARSSGLAEDNPICRRWAPVQLEHDHNHGHHDDHGESGQQHEHQQGHGGHHGHHREHSRHTHHHGSGRITVAASDAPQPSDRPQASDRKTIAAGHNERPTEGRELKCSKLGKALRRGQMRFEVAELLEFELPGDIGPEDFILAGSTWFRPAPPVVGLNWVKLGEGDLMKTKGTALSMPKHGRELKGNLGAKLLSDALASKELAGDELVFTEDEIFGFDVRSGHSKRFLAPLLALSVCH